MEMARERGEKLRRAAGISDRFDRFDVDEYELEEEIRSEFPCPFCYEDHDIASLCPHLEDDNPFESKVAICPICSIKVTGDMLSHVMLQHGNTFKLQNRRRLRKGGVPYGQALSLLGRDLREAHLQMLLGNGAYPATSTSTSTATADSLLSSSLVLNFPASEAEEISRSSLSYVDEIISKKPITWAWKSSVDLSLSKEEREKKQRQFTVRAKFVQDLLVSTLFDD